MKLPEGEYVDECYPVAEMYVINKMAYLTHDVLKVLS